MNRTYGFEGEVVAKYSRRVFELFTGRILSSLLTFEEIFCYLPLAAHLKGQDKAVLVLHGGSAFGYDELHGQVYSVMRTSHWRILKKSIEIGSHQIPVRISAIQINQPGVMCELLWSDPQEFPGTNCHWFI